MLYGAYDLAIESEIEVAGAQHRLETRQDSRAHQLPDAEPDLRIVQQSQSSSGLLHAGGTPYFVEGDGAFLFRKAGTAVYRIDACARQIAVAREMAAADEDVGALLIATALPAALWLRGDLVLHAAAAVLPGMQGAVAIAGPSGCGKSTLLERLLSAGSRVLAEDTLCLRESGLGVLGSGLPAAIHLRAGDCTEPRTMLRVPVESQIRSAAVRSLVVLEAPGVARGSGLTRLCGTDALAALLRNLHRPRVPCLAGRIAGVLPRLASLLPALAIFAYRPLDSRYTSLPEAQLLREIADAGV